MTGNLISGLHSIKKEVSVESVARYFGGKGYKLDDRTRDRITDCVDASCRLIAPQAAYTLFPVAEVIPGSGLVLGSGEMLQLPECFTDTGSRFVAAVVGTLGPELEKHCRDLANNGAVYNSTLFDAVGTAMLDILSEKACQFLGNESGQGKLYCGQRFAPGIDGFPLEKQFQLFEMADNESVGVSLNSSAIMVPAKSISFFLLLSKTVPKSAAVHKCSLCQMYDCQFRMNHIV